MNENHTRTISPAGAAGLCCLAFVACVVLLASCKKIDPLYCSEEKPCTDPALPFCDLTGEFPASEGIRNTCIPSPFDAGVGVDATVVADAGASTDALPADAAPPASAVFDVAYVDRFLLSSGDAPFQMSGILLVVNTGTETLDLAALQVISTTHDHPSATFVLEPHAPCICPQLFPAQAGEASGKLEDVPELLIVGDGLVTEPRVNTGYPHYRIRAADLPSGSYTIQGQAQLRLGNDGPVAEMPLRLDVVNGSSPSTVSARRVSAE